MSMEITASAAANDSEPNEPDFGSDPIGVSKKKSASGKEKSSATSTREWEKKIELLKKDGTPEMHVNGNDSNCFLYQDGKRTVCVSRKT